METSPPLEAPIIATLRRQVVDLMSVEQTEVLQPPDGAIAFHGQVFGDTDAAFERLSERFAAHGYTAHLRRRRGGHVAIATKGVIKSRPGRVWINAALFVATVVTALVMNITPEAAAYRPPGWYLSGVPFAATLLGILVAHELSHYFVARRYGSPVSLPYFIPMPLSFLGTMGAVIVQRAPMRDRKALFDIGIAGPLGGLVLALPLLVFGLALSPVGRASEFIDPSLDVEVFQEGNSLLYLAVKYLMFGRILPSGGEDVWLHPIALAAWTGLLVTALNLLPISQLDGGHVAYALLGRRAWVLAWGFVGALVALGGLLMLRGNPAATTWFIWAGLAIFFRPQHPPPLNDVGRLGGVRALLGVILFVILVITFVPVPLVAVPTP